MIDLPVDCALCRIPEAIIASSTIANGLVRLCEIHSSSSYIRSFPKFKLKFYRAYPFGLYHFYLRLLSGESLILIQRARILLGILLVIYQLATSEIFSAVKSLTSRCTKRPLWSLYRRQVEVRSFGPYRHY
jgi:hypothetical protein